MSPWFSSIPSGQGKEKELATGNRYASYPGLLCIFQALYLVPEDYDTSLFNLKYGTHTKCLHGLHKLLPAIGGWEW